MQNFISALSGDIQDLPGHGSSKPPEIYTHGVKTPAGRNKSPLDYLLNDGKNGVKT